MTKTISKTNKGIFYGLVKDKKINFGVGSEWKWLFDIIPASNLQKVDWDRVEGMMLGLAIGDALGNTTEGWLPEKRREIYGEIRDYLPSCQVEGKAAGTPSDDTQLAFWTLEQIIEDGKFSPEKLADMLSKRNIFGIGLTVNQAINNYKNGKPWSECGIASAGNGALMRIAPVVIPYINKQTNNIRYDAILNTIITHNDPATIASSIAFTEILWGVLGGLNSKNHYNSDNWFERYMLLAKSIEGYYPYESESLNFPKYKGPISSFVKEQIKMAREKDLSVLEACNLWGSGSYLMETLPSVIYILMRHSHDPEEAIIRAVNDTKDNDTIAAIVGACVGARYGKKALPKRWINNLTGRTSYDDDGRIFDILNAAKERWGK